MFLLLIFLYKIYLLFIQVIFTVHVGVSKCGLCSVSSDFGLEQTIGIALWVCENFKEIIVVILLACAFFRSQAFLFLFFILS